MFTKEMFIRWMQLSYRNTEHYGGWELMWQPDSVPHKEKLVSKEDELKELNKEMIKQYPFLLPRNRWTDKISDDYDYNYNEWEAIDFGWQVAFGWEFLNELAEAINKLEHPENFRIIQIKEKFGTLRFYCHGSREIYDVVNKYEKKSLYTCIYCGKPTKYVTRGWITYICKDCAKDMNPEDYSPISEGEDND